MDCCLAGAADLGKSGEDEAIKARGNMEKIFKDGSGKCILASSLDGQSSYPMKGSEYSLFTYYLLSGLKGGNGMAVNENGYVTPYKLSNYVYNAMPLDRQKPVTKFALCGDIIIAEYPDLAEGESYSMIRRYPYASFPRQIRVGETKSLEIHIAANRPADMDVNEQKIYFLKGKTEVPMLVKTICNPQNLLEFMDGRTHFKFGIPTDRRILDKLLFQLSAKAVGKCKINLFVTRLDESSNLATMQLETEVIGNEQRSDKSESERMLQQIVVEEPRLTFNARRPADMSLIVDVSPRGPLNETEIEISLIAPSLNYPYLRSPRRKLLPFPELQARAFFEDMDEATKLNNKEAWIAEEAIKSKGRELYRTLISDTAIHEVIWNNLYKIKSIHVISNESWIPWELIKPFQGSSEGQVICESCALTKWRMGHPQQTKNVINKITFISPNDPNLISSRQEFEWIRNFSSNRKLEFSLASEFEDVMSLLKGRDCDVLQFSSTNSSNETGPDACQILVGKSAYLHPHDISGANAEFGRNNPLVILNVQQTGSQIRYTGITRWAEAFISAGVCAFIGTTWSVTGQAAFVFTRVLYQMLSEQVALDEAVRRARLAIKKECPGDPSWLAYCLFGSPGVKFRVGRE